MSALNETRPHPMLLSGLLYASLIWSSALQFTFGPEAVLRPAEYFTANVDTRDDSFRAWYPDYGSLAHDGAGSSALRSSQSWKFTSFWADAAYYVRQVRVHADSVPPYRYRLLPTAIVSVLASFTGLSVEQAFVVFNTLVALATALVFEHYLIVCFGFERLLAVLGGCLCITSVSNAGTLAFPMLEPASSFCSCLVFLSVARGHVAGFVSACVLGVATKEVLLFAGPLWWLAAPTANGSQLKRVLLAGAPLLAFVLLRLALGGSALEVNYGFDLLRGQFPRYGQRLLGLRSLLGVLLQVFCAFSFLWLGLLNIPRQPLLRRAWIVVPLVIAASILLSSRLTRVLGVLFPIVVPGFLLFFAKPQVRRGEA